MINLWFYVPLGIGSLAFFATLYLTIFVPEASDTPWQEEGAECVASSPQEHPLRRWDTVLTWLMWGGWGTAMVMHFLSKNELLDQFTDWLPL